MPESFRIETPVAAPPSTEREKPRTTLERLRAVMARMAEEINDSVERKYGLHRVVDETGRVQTAEYAVENGGIYEQAELDEDTETVDALDWYHSAADDPNVQEFYKVKHNIETPEGIVRYRLDEKEKSRSNQAEMAITALLHRFLSERFLVVRASTFDDYKHGTDNVILDTETGAVVCAFDEVLRNDSDQKQSPAKIEKIKKKAFLGGTEVKYGFSLRDGKLNRERIREKPAGKFRRSAYTGRARPFHASRPVRSRTKNDAR